MKKPMKESSLKLEKGKNMQTKILEIDNFFVPNNVNDKFEKL